MAGPWVASVLLPQCQAQSYVICMRALHHMPTPYLRLIQLIPQEQAQDMHTWRVLILDEIAAAANQSCRVNADVA